MQFDLPLNYDAGDEGPGGGIQVRSRPNQGPFQYPVYQNAPKSHLIPPHAICVGGDTRVLESATVKQSAHYVPDRVLRFTGEASANDPWPSLEEAGVVVEGEDEAASQR
eukprot:2737182-Rhodomonas_salina.2